MKISYKICLETKKNGFPRKKGSPPCPRTSPCLSFVLCFFYMILPEYPFFGKSKTPMQAYGASN